MSERPCNDPYVRQSLFKRIARPILYRLQKVLPERVYAGLYFPLFGLYRRILRFRYWCGLLAARVAGDQQTVVKKQVVHRVMPYSLVGTSGLEHTFDLAARAVEENVGGAFVECGVAQGGCSALMASVATASSPIRECWLFDSYEGLPDPTTDDFEDGATGQHVRPLPKGSCLGTYQQVSDLMFNKMGFAREPIHLVKGWFQDTLPVHKPKIGEIAVLRVDGDWYESTKCCLDTLYDQVSPGGAVIIDDYHSCHGAKTATDEFLRDREIDASLTSDGRGGASFTKPRGDDQRRAVSDAA